MFFLWSVSDSKSLQFSRSLLSILSDLNNAVIWTVSTRPINSKYSRPCINPLVTVPREQITIGIIDTFMFYSFFNSLARSRYLSVFSHSFAGTAKYTILQVLSFSLIIIRSGRLAKIRWFVSIIIIIPLEFFTSALADGLLLEFEWQQVSSSLQYSSQYSGCSQLCCSLDGLHSSPNLQFLQSL